MKKLIAMLVLLGACSSNPAPQTAPGSAQTGAPDARGAVVGFMTAVKNQDLQAMSVYWGTADGAARDNGVMTRDQLEQRELIMLGCLKHDRYQIVTEAPAPAGERAFALELAYGGQSHSTTAYAVQGPKARWYLRSVDIEPLREICTSSR